MKKYLTAITVALSFALTTISAQKAQAHNYWGSASNSGCHYWYPYNGWDHHCHDDDSVLIFLGVTAAVLLVCWIVLVAISDDDTEESVISFMEGDTIDFEQGQFYYKPELDFAVENDYKLGLRAGFKW